MFKNSAFTARELARELTANDLSYDVICSLTGDQTAFASTVAAEVGCPHRHLVACEITLEDDSAEQIGAIASDGSVWFEDHAEHRSLSETAVREAVTESHRRAQETARDIEEEHRLCGLDDQSALLVDDGTTSPAVVMACLRNLKAARAERVNLAVGSTTTAALEQFEREASTILCLDLRTEHTEEDEQALSRSSQRLP